MTSQHQHSPGPDALRFDRFEVRLHSEMLLRDNKRIKIQDLPFRLLLALIEIPGQIASSEELGRRLGGPGSPLEVASLRVAATKLREALGDNPRAPRFIKTISGQGYKFIADVKPVAEAVSDSVSTPIGDSDSGAGTPPLSLLPALALATPKEASLLTRRTPQAARLIPFLALGLAILLATTLAAYPLYRREHRALAGDRETIVLGGFINGTPNQEMDGTLSSAFQVKMEESPYLKLVANRKFRELVRNPETATLYDELKACRALQGQILLRGQLIDHNPGPQVVLTAWACPDGRKLSTQRTNADSEAEILPALSLAAEQMRRRMGEPDETLQKFNVPLSQATTSSLAALRAFTEGEEKRALGLEFESIRDYKLALDLDPQFALAYARLGSVYFNSGEYLLSRENLKKAFELHGRTTDRERLYITANYYAFATGEIQRATETYELWRKVYPLDIVPVNNLGIMYLLVGKPEKAVDLARTAVQLEPTANLQYGTWAQAYLKTGDYESLNKLCNGPVGQGNNFAVFHVHCFQGAFAENDEAGMQRQLRLVQGKSQQGLLLQEAALVALCQGKTAESWRLFSQAKQIALKNNLIEFAAGAGLTEATLKADVGLARDARNDALDAMKLVPDSPATQASAALALARAGDIVHAQAEADKAAEQSPMDTLLNSAILASTRAAIHMQKHEPEAALQSLEETRAYDSNELMLLASGYYRGLAYLQNKQSEVAVREFQRVLDHRVLAPDSPYLALSQLELGRALQLGGDVTHAALAYRKAEELWNGSDPDFPPLRDLHRYERQLSSITVR